MRKINVDIKKLVELKEQGKTEKEITEYLNEEGIQISIAAVNQRLTEYYYIMGQEKPKKRRDVKRIDIDIEELVELKEQGWSDAKISEYMTKQGEAISLSTVNTRLTSYYDNLGTEKPKHNKIDVDIKKLVKLKEQGWSDAKISEYMTEQGETISLSTVNTRLTSYYDNLGTEKPKHNKNKIDVDINKLVTLKEQEMTLEQIAKYLNEQGIEISAATIRNRLIEYYNSQRSDKTTKIYDDDVKEVLMRGMTIEEFINQHAQQDNEEEIREKFKKLRVVAEYSKKENRETIQDREFIRVLDLLEGPKENMNKFNSINSYIVEGKLEKGKINEIKDVIFHENTDLMVYIFERLRINLNKGYDERIFNKLKEEYVAKIDKYLRRIEQTDNNRRQIQKTNSAPNSSGDGR